MLYLMFFTEPPKRHEGKKLGWSKKDALRELRERDQDRKIRESLLALSNLF